MTRFLRYMEEIFIAIGSASTEKYRRLHKGVCDALAGRCTFQVLRYCPYEQSDLTHPLQAANLKGVVTRNAIDLGEIPELVGKEQTLVLTTDTMKKNGRVETPPDSCWIGKYDGQDLVDALINHRPISIGTATTAFLIGNQTENHHYQFLDTATIRLKDGVRISPELCKNNEVSGGVALAEVWGNGKDFEIIEATVAADQIPDVIIGALPKRAEEAMKTLLLSS